jgi:solute carrier family 35 protein C2
MKQSPSACSRGTPDARPGSTRTLLVTVEGLAIQSSLGGAGTSSMTSADGHTPSDSAISRWLAAQNNAPSAPLLSPGNEFPLRTLPSLPSDSSLSDLDSEHGTPVARPGAIAKLIHPPVTTTMENEQAALNHARRRSSSLAGAAAPPRTDAQKHRRRPSEHISEEGEEEHSSDAERSDSESPSDSTDLELDDMSADGLDDDEETGLTKRDRRRRRRRKRRNTLLDQRIVPTADTYTKEEKKLADQNLLRSMLINGVLIALWYVTWGEHATWQLTA